MPSDQSLIRVRKALASDFTFLKELHHRTLRAYVEELWGWDETQQDEMFTKQFCPENLEIIELAGSAIGLLEVTRDSREIFLKNILILPEHQKQGIGTYFLQDLIREAREKRLPLKLTVLRPNPAIHFYKKLGFECTAGDFYRFHMELADRTKLFIT